MADIATALIQLSLSVPLASAVRRVTGKSSVEEAVRSVLDKSAPEESEPEEQPSVEDPPVHREKPIDIIIPPKPPEEEVVTILVTVGKYTMLWLSNEAQRRDVAVEYLVMHLLENAVRKRV